MIGERQLKALYLFKNVETRGVGRCLCAKTLCLILRIINRGTIKRVWYNGCTLAFHVNEDEFDSHYPLQLFSCSLAQLVEHSTDNRVVAGSSPARTTKDLMRLKLNWMSSGLLHHRLQVRILSGVPINNMALVLMVARWIPNPKVRVRISP